VTAPDSPAVVNARREAEAQRSWGDPRVADTLDGVLAELAEACRQPRVWLEGDEVPAGVVVIPASGHAFRTGPGPYRVQFEPLVEAVDYAAAVAAERELRTIAAETPVEPPQTPPGQCETDQGACGPQRGVQGRESAPADGSHTVTEQWDAHGGDVVWRTCTCGEKWTNDVETCPEAHVTTANPTEHLRQAADELERDGHWGAAADSTTALAAWMRAEADRPERGAWDDRVLAKAADLADQILRGAS
jgi:hypothetical protein